MTRRSIDWRKAKKPEENQRTVVVMTWGICGTVGHDSKTMEVASDIETCELLDDKLHWFLLVAHIPLMLRKLCADGGTLVKRLLRVDNIKGWIREGHTTDSRLPKCSPPWT